MFGAVGSRASGRREGGVGFSICSDGVIRDHLPQSTEAVTGGGAHAAVYFQYEGLGADGPVLDLRLQRLSLHGYIGI